MPLNKPNLFSNNSPSKEEFLSKYWHKSPVLLKNAVAIKDLAVFPDKSQLQKLSCDEDIQSRIVFKNSENSYDVEYGAFASDDWLDIEQNNQSECWNLLVSDIDKWYPSSNKILKYFNFIRNWIFDDIMLSCGSIGGTVGPHTDHYVVFLLQVQGQRRWDYSRNKIFNPDLIPEQALKLMANFQAEESYVLNPGDVLYLPPEVAHYGIATSDDCVTCSVGIRLPSYAELLTSFVDEIAQKQSENDRLVEPEFKIQPKTGEITQADLNQIEQILSSKLTSKNNNILIWFGKYITLYRNIFFEFNQTLDENELNQIFKDKNDLILSPFSKACYFKQDNIEQSESALLFVNGNQFESSLLFAQLLCDDKIISYQQQQNLKQYDRKVLTTLLQDGALLSK